MTEPPAIAGPTTNLPPDPASRSATMRLRHCARARLDSEHLLLLKAVLLWAAIAIAFLAAWRTDLLQRTWRGDATGLPVAVTLVFLGAAAHGSAQVLRLARVLNHLERVRETIASGVRAQHRGSGWIDLMPKGCVSEYIRNLQRKAQLAGPRARLD